MCSIFSMLCGTTQFHSTLVYWDGARSFENNIYASQPSKPKWFSQIMVGPFLPTKIIKFVFNMNYGVHTASDKLLIIEQWLQINWRPTRSRWVSRNAMNEAPLQWFFLMRHSKKVCYLRMWRKQLQYSHTVWTWINKPSTYRSMYSDKHGHIFPLDTAVNHFPLAGSQCYAATASQAV